MHALSRQLARVSVLVMLFSTKALCEYNLERLGEAGGAYIGGIAMMAALQESECGYAIKRTYNVRDAFNEVVSTLSEQDYKELEKEMITDGGLMQLSNQMTVLILRGIEANKRGGMDPKSSCGMLIGTTLSTLQKYQTNWDTIKSRYAYHVQPRAKVFDLDGVLEAVFFDKPQVTGEITIAGNTIRGFNSVDYDNVIIYTATYQKNSSVYKGVPLDEVVSLHIDAEAEAIAGTITRKNVEILGDHARGEYVIEFTTQGVTGRKYCLLEYKKGRFFSWTVQEIPGTSKLNGKTVFDTYAKDFRILTK